MLSCFIKNAKIRSPNECANQNENVVKSTAMQPYQDLLYILNKPVARMLACWKLDMDPVLCGALPGVKASFSEAGVAFCCAWSNARLGSGIVDEPSGTLNEGKAKERPRPAKDK
jgi:hypothetical protein